LSVNGSSSVTLHDVLAGEVWLGSGQSNMEFRVDQTRDSRQTIAQAGDPKIRLFLQRPIMSAKPLDFPEGEWKVCSPKSVGNFSAVAYFFGSNLRKALKVPVGLIASSWGGSYAESWTPEKVLKSDPAFKPLWSRWNKLPAAERNGWQKGRFPVDLALRNLRLIPRAPSQAPLTIRAAGVSSPAASGNGPGIWSWSVKDGSNLAVTILSNAPRMTGSFLSDAWGFMTTSLGSGKPLDLSTYTSVEFEAKGDGKYILFLSQPTITDWDNYRTPESFPVTKRWKRIRIPFSSLKQSGWGKPQPFTPNAVLNLSFGVDPKPLIDIPSALYNGMIHPLVPFPIRGVLWYQGEANAIRAPDYGKLLTAMIGGWRKAWELPEMPFLLAQLPNFIPGTGQGKDQWAELRDQQRKVAAEPHNQMAVLIDLGEHHDIHPKAKAPVGFRLAQAALSEVYGDKKTSLSPQFGRMDLDGTKLRVHFKDAEEGLATVGGEIKGLEIAGPDGRFTKALAKIEKDDLTVWSPSVTDPRSVRYDWGDDPDGNIFGKNGLPAGPFMEKLPSSKTASN